MARLDGGDPAYLAGLLAGTAHAVERARQQQAVSVVWTGPESSVTTSRMTAATVIYLIAEARYEILLVSFAKQTEPGISAALKAASAQGVSIRLLAEKSCRQPLAAALSVTGARLPRKRQRTDSWWPGYGRAAISP